MTYILPFLIPSALPFCLHDLLVETSWDRCHQLLTLTFVPSCILVICPLLYWTSFDAALHPTKLCPIIHKRKGHLPNFPIVHRTLGRLLLIFLACFPSFFSASFERTLPATFPHFFHRFISFLPFFVSLTNSLVPFHFHFSSSSSTFVPSFLITPPLPLAFPSSFLLHTPLLECTSPQVSHFGY